ncbi:kininogen-1 isoform X2 [Protopterus annectens]|uniref:kininogen-1 isoform X2 n=1 Tax=Protopterus annectens TaxID=7888 RepID=UPI001CFB1B97|nr:kininogen-1 isoform X2 [Protopterus annectens]
MKALIVLLFSFQFIPHCSEAALQNVACDNKEVFDAVDQAIQQLNEEKTTGNKFILHRILDAYINLKNETGTQYLVKFEIQEGNCSVGSKIAWTSCNIYISELIVNGICASEVFLDNTVRSKHVVTQTCTTKQVGPCHGCPISVDNNNPILEEPLRIAINAFNSNSSSPFLYGVVQIKTATSQVTAGLNYKIELTMQETNCTKATMETWTKDCPFKEYAPMLHCKTSVFIVSYENRTEVDISCKKTGRYISGLTPFSVLNGREFEESDEKHSQTAIKEHDRGLGLSFGYGHGVGHSPGQGHGRGKGQGHNYGHGHGHEEGHRNGHGRDKPKDKHEQKPHGHKHPKQESSKEKHIAEHGQRPPYPPVVKPKPSPGLVTSKPTPSVAVPPPVLKPSVPESAVHDIVPEPTHDTIKDLPSEVTQQSTGLLPTLPPNLEEILLPLPTENFPDFPDEPVSLNCPSNIWKPDSQPSPDLAIQE